MNKEEKEAIDQDPEGVLAALRDDLNTPLALTRLFKLADTLNGTSDPATRASLAARLRYEGAFLGILQQDPKSWLQQGMRDLSPQDIQEIEALIDERNQARTTKDFARSDAIRQQLLERNIVLEDCAQETKWRRRREGDK